MKSDIPVKEDQEITLTIEGVGEKGDGMARLQGYVIFVPGAEEGQTYLVKIRKANPKCGFAEIITGGN